MSYLVDVRSLSGSLAASRRVRDSLDVGDVLLGDQEYAFPGPVRFEVTLTNTGGGFVATGSAETDVRTQCVRCLCECSMRVRAPLDAFYIMPGREDEVPHEQEFGLIIEGTKVDLEPAVRQAVILELPFAPVHDPDCKGICPVCGADRNVETCACVAETVSSRFAALEGLETPDGA